jgi:hypothetical protein
MKITMWRKHQKHSKKELPSCCCIKTPLTRTESQCHVSIETLIACSTLDLNAHDRSFAACLSWPKRFRPAMWSFFSIIKMYSPIRKTLKLSSSHKWKEKRRSSACSRKQNPWAQKRSATKEDRKVGNASFSTRDARIWLQICEVKFPRSICSDFLGSASRTDGRTEEVGGGAQVCARWKLCRKIAALCAASFLIQLQGALYGDVRCNLRHSLWMFAEVIWFQMAFCDADYFQFESAQIEFHGM